MRAYITEHNKRVQETRTRKEQERKMDTYFGRAMIVIIACLAVITITQLPQALDSMWEQQYEQVNK